MYFKHSRRLTGRILLLLVMLLMVGLTGLGCIEGLQPIGWSGGAVSGDTLFVGSKEGKLVAVNTVDESRQWSEPLKASAQAGGFGCAPTGGGGCATAAAGVAIYGTPALSGDLAYIGAYNGKFYAFNSSSLDVRWLYPREGNMEPIVGGAVVAVRRAGAVTTFDAINNFFLYGQMFVPGSSYWNVVIGLNPGDVESDAEGMGIMKNLGQNMAFLLKKVNV